MKTNKKLTKTILLSSLAIAAFGSVAAGTTYALFTSKAESSITVTTGKVSVSQQVEIKERYTPALINEDGTIADKTNAFDEATGFEVTVTDNDVAVTKMLPGDKVTLTITPKNDSNVKIKYRETYAITGDENDVLNVTGESGMITHWTVLEAGGTIEAYEVSIEIPATATEGVEDAKITLGLEAVQSNAKVYDTEVSDAAGLEEALKSDEEFVSIKMNNDITIDGKYEITTKNITIYGSGDEKNSTKLTAKKSRVFNIFGSDYETLNGGSLTLSGVVLETSQTDAGPSYSRALNIYGTKNYTITIDSSTINTSHYAIDVEESSGDPLSPNENLNLIVRNSTINGYACFQSRSDGVKATFENCILNGVNDFEYSSSNGYAIIEIYSGSEGVFNFNDCTFNMHRKNGNKEIILQTTGTGNTFNFNHCYYSDVSNKTGEEVNIGKTEINDDTPDSYFESIPLETININF